MIYYFIILNYYLKTYFLKVKFKFKFKFNKMTEKKLGTLSNDEFKEYCSKPDELILKDEDTPQDISDWEDLYNELFVNHPNLFPLEKKTYIVRLQLKKIIENDKLNETNNYTIFYTKHEKLIKKIIANSENSLQK